MRIKSAIILTAFILLQSVCLSLQADDLNFDEIIASIDKGPDFGENMQWVSGEARVALASKSSELVQDAPAIVSVVTREEIKDLGARSLKDILNLIPGIEMNRAIMFGVHNTIGVRGRMTDFGEDVLVLLDGQRLNDVYTGGGTHQLKYLPVENIKRIEIIRGPGSSLYGSNAFVGVINIITETAKDIIKDDQLGSIEIFGGSFDSYGGQLKLAAKKEAFSMSTSFRYGKDDGDVYDIERGFMRPPVDLPEVSDPIENSYDASFRLAYKNLKFQYDYFKRELDGFMPWGFLDKSWESDLLDTNQDDSEVSRMQLSYDWKLKENLLLTSTVRFLKGEIDQLYFLAPPGTAMFEGTSAYSIGWFGNPSHKTENYEFEVQMNYKAGSHNIVGGVLVEQEKLTWVKNRFNVFPFSAPMLDYGSEFHWFDGANSYADPTDRDIYGVYIQDTWKINSDLGFVFGLRFDDYDDFGNSTNPRTGLIYKFNEKFSMKALYGKSYRAPTFNELYIRNNPVQRGNEELNAQEISTYELNFNFIPSKTFIASINAYYNEYEDLIKLRSIESSPFPTYYNSTEEEKDKGCEFELRYQPQAKKYIALNYAYIDPEDEDGETRGDIATDKFSIIANTDILSGKVILNVSSFYRGNRENPTNDSYHDIDDEWIVNSNIRILNIFKGAELNISLNNITDEQWLSPGFSPALAPDNVANRGFSGEVRVKCIF